MPDRGWDELAPKRHFPTRREAADAERRAIREENPVYNKTGNPVRPRGRGITERQLDRVLAALEAYGC